MIAAILEIVVTLALCALGWWVAGRALDFVDKRAPGWTSHVSIAIGSAVALWMLHLEGPLWADALVIGGWVVLAAVVIVAEAIDPWYDWRIRRAMRRAGYAEESIDAEIAALRARVDARRKARREKRS